MTIAAWGDSITYGSCDEEGLGWVGRIRKTYAPREDYSEVYNRGVSGNTTEDLIVRFLPELRSIRPDKILIAIGINDSRVRAGKTESEVPLEQFASNVTILIGQARDFDTSTAIVLIGPTAVNAEAISDSGTRFVNNTIALYRDALKKIAEESQLNFIDLFETLDIQTDLADGLHPNARGYEKLAAKIQAHL